MRELEFEGAVHEFPDDASDDEIRSALGGDQTAPAAPREKGYGERVLDRYGAIPGRIASGVYEAVKPSGSVGGHLMGGLEVLGAVFEPVLAPFGEAGRSLGYEAAESFLRTGIAPGAEGFAPEPVDVSNVTPEEAAQVREGTGGAYAMGAEAAAGFGRPVANVAAKLGIRTPSLASKITPIGQKALGMMGPEQVSVAKITESPMMDFWHNVASKSFWGSGKMAQHEAKGTKWVEQAAGDFAHAMGQSIQDPQMRGELLRHLVDDTDEAMRAAGSAQFRLVDEINPNPIVDMLPVERLVGGLRRQFPEGTEAGNLLKTIEAQVASKVVQPPDPFQSLRAIGFQGIPPAPAPYTVPSAKSFLESNDLRSWAYSWKQPGISPVNDQAVRVGRMVGKAIDETIIRAGRTLDPQAAAQLQRARDFWGQQSATFNVPAIRKILIEGKVTPEDVVTNFVKPNAHSEIQAFEKMLGGSESEAWGVVRRSFVEDLLQKSSPISQVAGREVLDGKLLTDNLKRWGDTTKTVLGSKHQRNLQDLAEVLFVHQKEVTGGGGMAIQMKQSGVILTGAAFLGGGTGPGAVAAGMVILGPRVLAQIFTSERATRVLLEGIRFKPGSAGAVRAAATLSNFLQPGQRESQEADIEKVFGPYFKEKGK